MSLAIPASIDDVSADWLSEAMGVPVTGVSAEQIGVGIGVTSAIYRVSLEGGTDAVPDTVVVKLPALDEAALFTSMVLRMYIREVRFYRELAPECPIRVPAAYHADVDEGSSQFVLVLEDVGSLRRVDQIEGMGRADAERAVDELASWQTHWWNAEAPIVARGTAIAINDPLYPAVLPMVFTEGWEKINSELEVSPEIAAVGPGWVEAMPRMLQHLSSGPTTLCHGDYRADNMAFDGGGKLTMLDFQLIGAGTASFDLAYFITGSLRSDVASAAESALFERWLEALVVGGAPGADPTALWERYRTAALFCLVYPVVACRGMDLADDRQRALINLMNDRLSRAVDELNLPDLL